MVRAAPAVRRWQCGDKCLRRPAQTKHLIVVRRRSASKRLLRARGKFLAGMAAGGGSVSDEVHHEIIFQLLGPGRHRIQPEASSAFVILSKFRTEVIDTIVADSMLHNEQYLIQWHMHVVGDTARGDPPVVFCSSTKASSPQDANHASSEHVHRIRHIRHLASTKSWRARA